MEYVRSQLGRPYSTADTAKVIPIAAAMSGNFSGGVISGKLMKANEYSPAPPIPCKARNTITWMRDWLRPAPRENAIRMTRAYHRFSVRT